MIGGRRRAVLVASATAVFVAVAAVVLVWFQPQKLVLDDEVDETLVADDTAALLAQGAFVSLDHPTTGRVRVLDVGDRRRLLRLDDLDTTNGPALRVYLSTTPADGEEATFDDHFVDLGELRGNRGDLTYPLPRDVDLGDYASVVIWCERFDAAFGAADLEVT